jgi:hypothetical protein
VNDQLKRTGKLFAALLLLAAVGLGSIHCGTSGGKSPGGTKAGTTCSGDDAGDNCRPGEGSGD